MRTALPFVLGLALLALGCNRPPPVVNVEAPPPPPCDCQCSFRAVAPEIGRGCWVKDDVLVCPLVKRTLDIEPAYPGEDPRCERQPDGSIRCGVE